MLAVRIAALLPAILKMQPRRDEEHEGFFWVDFTTACSKRRLDSGISAGA
jgi:hypothetical protein